MKKPNISPMFLVLAAVLLIGAPARAEYAITQSVFGNGGMPVQSGIYQMNSTAGQPAIGVVVNPPIRHEIGFWHTVVVEVTDDYGNRSSSQTTVTVEDTTPPVVTVTATPEFLWPANHKYHTVVLNVIAEDAGDPSVSTFSATAVSSEADDAQESVKGKGKKSNGDGNTTGDIQATKPDGSVVQSSNDAPEVTFDPVMDILELCAERSGNKDGRTYTITVRATDAEGNTDTHTVEVTVDHDQASKPVATKPVLGGGASDGALTFAAENYPNPFNPETIIKYTLPEDGSVRLVVYNVLGQQVRELVNAAQAPGVYAVRWNGRDNLGRQVSSGLYLYRLEAGTHVVMKKMLLMK